MHTFSASIVNELRVGYTQNNTGITTSKPGVPSIYFDDGTAGFGSYSGYPQFFKEHDYSYGDMVSISHGKHNIKVGVDIKRNLENSEFNVARPSYEMFDPIYFAADAPAGEAAGVDPGFRRITPRHNWRPTFATGATLEYRRILPGRLEGLEAPNAESGHAL